MDERRGYMMIRKDFFAGIIFLAIFLVIFALCLGDIAVQNKFAAVQAMMEETRTELEQHPYSVVLVDKQLAEIIGFEPRGFDVNCGGGD